MISKWYGLKSQAIKMREAGTSIREVEKLLKIPRSTLSGWFKDIKLTKSQKNKLDKKWREALNIARKKAVVWHNKQKENRILEAENEAALILSKLDTKNKNILELALSFLYLGEGTKTQSTSMGNANPIILRFFIAAVKQIYNGAKLGRCELHLRSDQNELKEIEYWSKELQIAQENFGFVKDKRIIKSKTYLDYHGVCVVRFTSIAIQRRLVFLSHKFCNIITELDS